MDERILGYLTVKYETLYEIEGLLFKVPLFTMLLLSFFFILLGWGLSKKYRVKLGLLLSVGIVVSLILPLILSYSRYQELEKFIGNNQKRELSGVIKDIQKFNEATVYFIDDVYLKINHQDLYCLNYRLSSLHKQDIAHFKYYDLREIINSSSISGNVCITEVKKKIVYH